jgi:hypothetical protein
MKTELTRGQIIKVLDTYHTWLEEFKRPVYNRRYIDDFVYASEYIDTLTEAEYHAIGKKEDKLPEMTAEEILQDHLHLPNGNLPLGKDTLSRIYDAMEEYANQFKRQ